MGTIFAVVSTAVFICINYFWAVLIVKLIKTFRTLPKSDSFEQEKQRSKKFYRFVFTAFLAECIAFALVVAVSLVNYYVSNENPPIFNHPIIIAVFVGIVLFLAMHIFFIKFAHKFEVQNYDALTKKLCHIDSFDMGILGLSLFMACMHATIVGCVIYGIMLLL